jgi:hypothetical protein
MNRADRVARVVLAGEQRLGLGRHDFMFKTAEQWAQLIQRSFVFFSKFKEHSGVCDFAFEFLLPLDRALHAAALL